MINLIPNSLRQVLDGIVLPTLADALAKLHIGSILRALPTWRRQINMNTQPVSPYQLTTVQTLSLVDDAKALNILSAYARTGTAGTGPMTIAANGATPTSGQIAVAPNGDIVTLASDAITNVDIVYQPDKYDVVEVVLPVVSSTGILTLPVPNTTAGVVTLFEAEALVGTTIGKEKILVPGTAPATGQARLNVAKTQVLFATADAVTSARVKFSVSSAVDADALLTAASILI